MQLSKERIAPNADLLVSLNNFKDLIEREESVWPWEYLELIYKKKELKNLGL